MKSRTILIAAILLTPGFGCRDTQPVQSQDGNLGTEERPLLPPAATAWMNPALKEGKADWQPFREPKSESQPASERAADGSGDEPGTAPDTAAPTGPEAAIRAMVDDYNELVAEQKLDDLLDFFVEAQVDAAKDSVEKRAAAMAKLVEVRQSISSKLPDEADRIAAAFKSLEAVVGPQIELSSLSVISPTEATGTTVIFKDRPTYRFVLVDQDWYIEIPAESLEGMLAALTSIAPYLDRWKGELAAGQPDATTVLADMEKAAAPALPTGGG